LDSKEFSKKITGIIFNKKGYDVLIINLKELTSFADYFVICSADSNVQVKAIADDVDKSLRDEGIKNSKTYYRSIPSAKINGWWWEITSNNMS